VTQPMNPAATPSQPRTLKQILLSYFYWTYPRGSFHYDIMVTLILLFIGATPFFWNYGDKPSPNGGPVHPIQVVGNDDHGGVHVQRNCLGYALHGVLRTGRGRHG